MTQGVLSVAEWYAKIRSAATLCGFQDDLTRALKDKFVTGLAPGKILDRLCEEDDSKTIDELFALGQKTENQVTDRFSDIDFISSSAKLQRNGQTPPNRRNRNGSTVNRRHQSHQRSDVGKRLSYQNGGGKQQNQLNCQGINKNCYHCGSKHDGSCYYKNAKCNICSKIGHIAKVCYKKKHVNFIENLEPQIK
ncbi:uncharacterized protein isoform X2 [Leptinotarsa decemlineata]|uniref:uncharacterized protein isoform X2 n=1 Tax=Leptinotarsa decemlineata TaxID=7539 RepID=UPI003D307B18